MYYEAHFNLAEWSKAVKKRLIDEELTVTELAKEIGYSRNSTSLVVNGSISSIEARDRINKRLNIDISDYLS